MISYIKGKVESIEEDGAIVVENQNLGYEICVGKNFCSRLKKGDEVKVYTYMQVKEDGISLFGFPTLEDKKMFLQLITVSGIGPKMAIQISGSTSVNSLAAAIAYGNVEFFSAIKGIGKKTAERIILELKSKLSSFTAGTDLSGDITAGIEGGIISDAVGVLMSLGVNAQEAARAVNAVKGDTDKLDELINLALKRIGG